MENTIILIAIIAGGLFVAVLIPLLLAPRLKLALGHFTKPDSPPGTSVQASSLKHELIAPVTTNALPKDEWITEIDEDSLMDEEDELTMDDFEWLPMAESILLKQAEEVVDEIQNTINNIASLPVNREEVTTKLNAILSNFNIFRNTEYFEALNSYVTMAVKRDCDIELTEKEVHQLWIE
ncbi:hypothetical protein HNQ91_000712 [Filimonas zeae]|uniref:Uncharacterized protein n=1 Tax=Filimonas zeae TaxID=1737353 RepID=A0A917IQL7_9BACT|nr:hypothetical protein [Filimonas zeae]MDR6337690.1 hypothetical protein [Filimonas zeae]GGH59797.1 hypothetical protein GCM10011379_06980 [Filimonas zeae]